MKIEKLNDNQIRCTLTHADLADRQLKLSELVCGSEKAKSLFQDMMKQASAEFGFEADDMPLMIEAVPASSDTIVLVITKVDNPEELDSKFSRFGSSYGSSETNNRRKQVLDKLEGAEDIMDLIHKVTDAVRDTAKEKEQPEKDLKIRLFSFATLDSVILVSKLLHNIYHGANTLYKDTEDDVYLLALSQSEHTTSEFHKVCNMMSEYGASEPITNAILAFLEEHCDVIVSTNAIQTLANI